MTVALRASAGQRCYYCDQPLTDNDLATAYEVLGWESSGQTEPPKPPIWGRDEAWRSYQPNEGTSIHYGWAHAHCKAPPPLPPPRWQKIVGTIIGIPLLLFGFLGLLACVLFAVAIAGLTIVSIFGIVYMMAAFVVELLQSLI